MSIDSSKVLIEDVHGLCYWLNKVGIYWGVADELGCRAAAGMASIKNQNVKAPARPSEKAPPSDIFLP